MVDETGNVTWWSGIVNCSAKTALYMELRFIEMYPDLLEDTSSQQCRGHTIPPLGVVELFPMSTRRMIRIESYDLHEEHAVFGDISQRKLEIRNCANLTESYTPD